MNGWPTYVAVVLFCHCKELRRDGSLGRGFVLGVAVALASTTEVARSAAISSLTRGPIRALADARASGEKASAVLGHGGPSSGGRRGAGDLERRGRG